LLAAFARGPETAPGADPRARGATAGAGAAAGPGTRVTAGPAGATADGAPGAPGTDPRLADLTPREVDVLAALGRGLSNQGIAADLFITEATAKTHVSRVLAKLGVSTRMQAAIVARDTGLARARRPVRHRGDGQDPCLGRARDARGLGPHAGRARRARHGPRLSPPDGVPARAGAQRGRCRVTSSR